MSARHSASPLSSPDGYSDSSARSDVSGFDCAARPDEGQRSSTKRASFHLTPIASRSSPRGSAASSANASRESPNINSPKSRFSPRGSEQNAAHRSPKELFGGRPSLSAIAQSPGFRSSPRQLQQAAPAIGAGSDLEPRAASSAAAELKDYVHDPLMTLRTNREHSDLVIRERDDEPHLRFMTLHFTPATQQAVDAFRSDWSEERDALLQDDLFLRNKRAAFFCVFSDKQSLQSPAVKSHILRPSDIREVASSDPDGCTAHSFPDSDVNTNGASALDSTTPTAFSPSASSCMPLHASESAGNDGVAASRCHAVIHNLDTGASAICTMCCDLTASAADCPVDLPVISLPASSVKQFRPGQPRRGRPPSGAPSVVEDSPIPSPEIRPYSCVSLSSLGKDKAKFCVVPNMQAFCNGQTTVDAAPDSIAPALGTVGQCTLEDYEEFYSKEWEELSPIEREIRFQQLQLLKFAKKNTVYRNAVADALQAEIAAKAAKQRFPLADQKNIESALVVSSRSRQLQITMEAGLQPRSAGIPLPGDPEAAGDDAVCCVCYCGESLDDNQIVFCEGCNMAVHQSCYGIKNIPDGDWFCDSCVLSCKPTCVICRKKDGAFKVCVGALNVDGSSQAENGAPMQSPRESKQWVHVLCALWHPQVTFESLAVMREADVTSAEFFSKKTCVFCKQNGYLMMCPGKCRQHYHPMCAWLGGWFIEQAAASKQLAPSLSRKRGPECSSQAEMMMALLENTTYVQPMKIAAKCQACLDPSKRKGFDPVYNSKIRQSLSQVPLASGNKASKRGSAAILDDGSGRRMLHLVRRTFLPPDEFPPGACMICHFDVHNENRRKLKRSVLLTCSRGCGATVHEGCANMLSDDGCMDEDGSWTCMLCTEQESLGAIECMLCPRRGGLFQRCSEYPGWVHSICARLLCNVRPGFKGASISEPVNTGTIIQDYRDAKSKKVCCVCRQQGKVLHCCAHPGCEKYLHPICAVIKQCKAVFDTSKNGKNNCTLFCAQHSPVVDFAEADERALQEDAKNYANLLDIRIHLDKLRDLVNFSKRRERWKHHLDTVDLKILEQYEQRTQHGDAALFSAAILASPIIDGEPALAPATDECDSAAVDEFFPKKRDRNHAVWFDVPTRGGIGMIHVAKRKCPQVMFRYLNRLSKEEGREGWSYHAIEHDKSNDALLSPTKPRVHPARSGKTLFGFPPSPSGALFSGSSPRALRPSKDSFRPAAAFDWPPSPSDRPGSSQPGVTFGSAARSSARAASPSPLDNDARPSDGGGGEVVVFPRGTRIRVVRGRFAGFSGKILEYSNVGWYSASLKGQKGMSSKVRVSEFEVV